MMIILLWLYSFTFYVLNNSKSKITSTSYISPIKKGQVNTKIPLK